MPDAAPGFDRAGFAPALIAWQKRHGRNDLPWQRDRDPYRVWLSEVMLQQTQVATVIPYFQRFLARFPDVRALAAAPIDQVLGLWSGLGYYSRGRNLHRAAQLIVADHRGEFPRSSVELQRLPGIGRSTACAIAAFCFGERSAILDGNVRRVLARVHEVEGDTSSPAVQARLWAIAQQELPAATGDVQSDADNMQRHTQGMMDLGAMVCVRGRPRCGECPIASMCGAQVHGTVARFPSPRAARVLREEQLDLSWAINDEGDAVLMTVRPDDGIWGGLWCLPLRPPMADAEDAPLAAFTHRLTHRLLRIRVFRATGGPPQAFWMPFEQSGAAPLPAPIRIILDTLGPR